MLRHPERSGDVAQWKACPEPVEGDLLFLCGVHHNGLFLHPSLEACSSINNFSLRPLPQR